MRCSTNALTLYKQLSAKAGLPEASPQVVYALSAACRATAQQIGVCIGQKAKAPPYKLLASLSIGIANLFTQSLSTLRSASENVQVHRNLPTALACWPYIWRAAAFVQLAELDKQKSAIAAEKQASSGTGASHSYYNRLLVLAKAELDNLPRSPLILICDQFTLQCIRSEQDRIQDILENSRLSRIEQQRISEKSQVGDSILPKPKWMSTAAAIPFSPAPCQNKPLTGLGAYSMDTLQAAAKAAVKYDMAGSQTVAYKMYGHAITMISLILWHRHVRAIALGHHGVWQENMEDKLVQRITSYLKRQKGLMQSLQQTKAAEDKPILRQVSVPLQKGTIPAITNDNAPNLSKADETEKPFPSSEKSQAVHGRRRSRTVPVTAAENIRTFIAVPEDVARTLEVTNRDGEQQAVEKVEVDDSAIGTVSKPRVVNVGASSLAIHWILKGGKKTGIPVFQVEWRRRLVQTPDKWCQWQAESTLVVGLSSTTGIYTKHGLRSNSAYQFRVCVHGSRGKKNSTWSDPSDVAMTEASRGANDVNIGVRSSSLDADYVRKRSHTDSSLRSVTPNELSNEGRRTADLNTNIKSSDNEQDDAGVHVHVSYADESSSNHEHSRSSRRLLRAPSVDDDGNRLALIEASDVKYDDPPICLGQGGFGIVTRSAVGGYDGVTVAVKRVRPRSGQHNLGDSEQKEVIDSMIEELHSEARMLAKLCHANIVAILAINLNPGEGPFLVMEFCDHGTLKEVLHPRRRTPSSDKKDSGKKNRSKKGRRSCTLSLRARLILAQQIASAVAYLHARDPLIIHRDLKPANVLLTRVESHNGTNPGDISNSSEVLAMCEGGEELRLVAKLTDFGLSRSRERHGAAVNTVLGGSYPYLAPEAFRHNAITEAVDIYSFGIMLLEIATLNAPWSGLAPYQITMEVAVEQRRPNIPITAKIPQGIFSLVRDCWSHEQSNRPAAVEVEMRMANILNVLPKDMNT